MPDGTLDTAGFYSISVTGLSPSPVRLPSLFSYQVSCFLQSSTPGVLLPQVWPLSISLAATLKIDVSFSSSAYLDVSVQRVPPVYLFIQYTVTVFCTAGFLHSDICGSLDICSSPQLFAACHVLHRLLMPRHSPCALLSLIFLGSPLRSFELYESLPFTEKLFICIVQFSMYFLRLQTSDLFLSFVFPLSWWA